ncbi:MAG TPA: hypothetical protein ENK66_05160, partial [Arcobacter sp.]|nr:hypothetical protein [Arcobacter sp.]
MKYTSLFIFIMLFLTSCAQKKDEVVVYAPKKESIKEKKVEEKIILKNEPKVQSAFEAPKPKTIALVYAIKNIGKYSVESHNVIKTYLSAAKNNYIFKVYDIENESAQNYDTILDQLLEDKIENVIFLITDRYIDSLAENEKINNFKSYFPIINKDALTNKTNIKNLIFGGISYKKQFSTILNQLENKDNIFEIYDDKSISIILHEKLGMSINTYYRSIKINGKNPNYEKVLNRYRDLNQSSVILNTSIVKSSIILSQLRANDIIPHEIYSTQINYSPLIFVLSQNEDREGVKIANSIQKLPKEIDSIYNLIGTDIRYNWVNYSTLIGLEYFFNQSNLIFNNE